MQAATVWWDVQVCLEEFDAGLGGRGGSRAVAVLRPYRCRAEEAAAATWLLAYAAAPPPGPGARGRPGPSLRGHRLRWLRGTGTLFLVCVLPPFRSINGPSLVWFKHVTSAESDAALLDADLIGMSASAAVGSCSGTVRLSVVAPTAR